VKLLCKLYVIWMRRLIVYLVNLSKKRQPNVQRVYLMERVKFGKIMSPYT